MSPRHEAARTDGDRLLARIDALAAIGADSTGGVTRLAYSPEDVKARDVVAGWMAEAGLTTRVDAAGNLIGRRAGTGGHRAALVLGSHLDSVVEGGRLDGTYGVLAAIEAADAVRVAGLPLRHDLVVVAFSNEEGARGTPGMTGSRAVAGTLTPGELAVRDAEGVTLADRVASAGGSPEDVSDAAWDPADVAGYLELHIEQGPVLETRGRRIGVVTAVTGQAKLDLAVTGAANHSGTTPMDHRRDAAVAAAHLVLAVESLAAGGRVRTATTGRVGVGPGAYNIVPGEALLGVDLRDPDEERLMAALERLEDVAAEIAERTGVGVEPRPGPRVAPTPMDPWLRECIRAAADSLGASRTDLPSGAGHDAQIMARLGPAAMIFVPSPNGVSHSSEEDSRPADLVLGAEVLLRTLLLADAGT